MKKLLKEIEGCTLCADHLPLGPRPVLKATPTSKLIIIGQAPGTAVHASGVPWDDKSGENLREWTQMDTDTFYDSTQVGVIPLGFCYPGKGKSGDLPPRPECAPAWHEQLLKQMKEVELVLLIGKYAQNYYLGKQTKRTLTETVRSYQDYLPRYFVLPHPSPRNNIWQAKNPWFKEEVIPTLRKSVKQVLTK